MWGKSTALAHFIKRTMWAYSLYDWLIFDRAFSMVVVLMCSTVYFLAILFFFFFFSLRRGHPSREYFFQFKQMNIKEAWKNHFSLRSRGNYRYRISHRLESDEERIFYLQDSLIFNFLIAKNHWEDHFSLWSLSKFHTSSLPLDRFVFGCP